MCVYTVINIPSELEISHTVMNNTIIALSQIIYLYKIIKYGAQW